MAVGMLPTEMSVAIPAPERDSCCVLLPTDMRIEYLLQGEMAVAMLPREMSVAMLAAADEGMGAETHSEVSCLLIIRAICKHPLMSKSQGLTII
jgi:hypothetical protein